MAKNFHPGRLKQKIALLKHNGDKDESGELVKDGWVEFKSISASKQPLLGREFFTALTSETKVEVKFTMRYLPGIRTDMRIRHKDEVYQILSAINVDSANKEILCYCRLVSNV